MIALNSISADLDWRESEIGSMRILLASESVTPIQRQALLRAAWAMLYAHYEGFCKNSLTIYFEAVADSGATCKSLPSQTKLFALRKALKQLRTLADPDLLSAIHSFEQSHLVAPPIFPEIDTESNLWPSVLIGLLELADLRADIVREHQSKLKTLVERRNKIAHGEENFIAELSYYHSFENVVYDVLYNIAFQVDERLSLPPYVAV